MKKYKPTIDMITRNVDKHLEDGIPDLPFKVPEFTLMGKKVNLNDKE